MDFWERLVDQGGFLGRKDFQNKKQVKPFSACEIREISGWKLMSYLKPPLRFEGPHIAGMLFRSRLNTWLRVGERFPENGCHHASYNTCTLKVTLSRSDQMLQEWNRPARSSSAQAWHHCWGPYGVRTTQPTRGVHLVLKCLMDPTRGSQHMFFTHHA